MLKPIKGHPGRFLEVGSGKVLNISEYREGDKYDTIAIYNDDAVPMHAGAEYIFFRDIERKRLIDCNFTQPVRLSAGERMVVDRIGLHVRNVVGDTPLLLRDFLRVAEDAYLRIDVNKLMLTEGIAITFASGYGLQAETTQDDTAGNAIQGSMNVGVPSQAAAPKLLKTQTLTEKHEVIGYLTFYGREWGNHAPSEFEIAMPDIKSDVVFVTCFLHGLIKTAVNK